MTTATFRAIAETADFAQIAHFAEIAAAPITRDSVARLFADDLARLSQEPLRRSGDLAAKARAGRIRALAALGGFPRPAGGAAARAATPRPRLEELFDAPAPVFLRSAAGGR